MPSEKQASQRCKTSRVPVQIRLSSSIRSGRGAIVGNVGSHLPNTAATNIRKLRGCGVAEKFVAKLLEIHRTSRPTTQGHDTRRNRDAGPLPDEIENSISRRGQTPRNIGPTKSFRAGNSLGMLERVGRPAKQQVHHPVKRSRSLAKSFAVIPLEISKLHGKFRRIRFSDKADLPPSNSVLPRRPSNRV